MKSTICSEKPLLLFDFGTIIIDLDKARCVEALKKIGCGAIAGYVDEVRQEDLFHQLEIGGDLDIFFNEARRLSTTTDNNGKLVPCHATNEDISWAWCQLLTGIPVEKLRLIHHLRHDLGYRTALLSNTNRIHWDYSVEHFFTADGLSVGDYFEQVFLSCDMHMLKPDAEIYNTVAQTMGVKPTDILFIDDSEANCRGAIRCGLRAVYDPYGTRWTDTLIPILEGSGIAAVIGNFDGVHLGHQYVLKELQTAAKERHLTPLVITFDRHPRTLFQADFEQQLLNTPEERNEHINQILRTGPHSECDNYVHQLTFTYDMAQMSARDFMQHVLRDKLNVRMLLLGYDNHFGHRADGEGFDDYRRYGEELGIEVLMAKPFDHDGQRISSSLIRHLIGSGKISEANKALGYDYTLQGTVLHGYEEGRKIGFPTANLLPPEGKLLPPFGVYETDVLIDGETSTRAGITNIGSRPTYNGESVTIETHILNYIGNLYGKHITLRLKSMLRPERKFASPAELKEQIQKDIAQLKADTQ